MFLSVCVPSFFFSLFVLPTPLYFKTDRYHTTNPVLTSTGAGFDCRISRTCGKIYTKTCHNLAIFCRNKDKSYGLFIPLIHGDDREQTKSPPDQTQTTR